MTDNWQPGDLALCVRAGFVRANIMCGGKGLREGGIYTVAAFWVCPETADECLTLEKDYDAGEGRLASRFRKIHPLNEAEHASAMRELNAPVREKVS